VKGETGSADADVGSGSVGAADNGAPDTGPFAGSFSSPPRRPAEENTSLLKLSAPNVAGAKMVERLSAGGSPDSISAHIEDSRSSGRTLAAPWPAACPLPDPPEGPAAAPYAGAALNALNSPAVSTAGAVSYSVAVP
jgi:hypothetical protein